MSEIYNPIRQGDGNRADDSHKPKEAPKSTTASPNPSLGTFGSSISDLSSKAIETVSPVAFLQLLYGVTVLLFKTVVMFARHLFDISPRVGMAAAAFLALGLMYFCCWLKTCLIASALVLSEIMCVCVFFILLAFLIYVASKKVVSSDSDHVMKSSLNLKKSVFSMMERAVTLIQNAPGFIYSSVLDIVRMDSKHCTMSCWVSRPDLQITTAQKSSMEGETSDWLEAAFIAEGENIDDFLN